MGLVITTGSVLVGRKITLQGVHYSPLLSAQNNELEYISLPLLATQEPKMRKREGENISLKFNLLIVNGRDSAIIEL